MWGKKISAGASVFVIGAMLGLSFASVPLYRLFCAATGYGGTTQVAKTAPGYLGARKLTVQFDANVAAGLPWKLTPEINELEVRTGETVTVFYRVTNDSDHETRGMAAYNVSPDQTGAYFNKISCFCFNEQKLGPRESADWPVVFFLDPALERDGTMNKVDAVTLSYTVFSVKGPAASAQNAVSAGGKPKT